MDISKDLKRILSCLIVLFVMSHQTNGQSTGWDGELWHSPVIIPPNASIEEKNRLKSFNQELAYAKDAADKSNVYKMTDHLEKALKYRPEHPDNVRLEYKMAVAMSQYENSENKITPARRLKAMNLFKKIADTYNHMDYYSNSLTDSESIECPQLMVSRACNHYAKSRIRYKDFEAAKKYATIALDCLAETTNKRVSFYLNRPEPQRRSSVFSTIGAEEKYQRSVETWKAMKERAKAGDVLGDGEILYSQIFVRTYGISYGDNQNFGDVTASMTEVIEKYEGTPMAKFAEEFLIKSKERMIQRVESDIFLDPDFNTAQTPTSAINDSPIVDKPSSLEKTDIESKTITNDLPEKHQESKQNNTTVYIVIILVIIALIILTIYRKKR